MKVWALEDEVEEDGKEFKWGRIWEIVSLRSERWDIRIIIKNSNVREWGRIWEIGCFGIWKERYKSNRENSNEREWGRIREIGSFGIWKERYKNSEIPKRNKRNMSERNKKG